MTMQVQRVGVVGAVVEGQAVTGALLDGKLLLVRVGLAVHGEHVEAACSAWHLFKHHVELFGWRGLRRWRFAEDRIVPTGLGRRRPLRSAVLVGVLDDNAEA